MAFDAFIQLEGIKGESSDEKHKEWIEIQNYGFGAAQPQSNTASSSGNLGSARVEIKNFTFLHNLDIASPKLFEYCCTGMTIPKATITLNRAGGQKEKYMEYKLTDVIVTSVSRDGAADRTQDVPLEAVSLGFGKVEMTYSKIGIDGKSAGNASAGWDLKKNVKV